MISILIPIYNTSVVDLVRDLAAQCSGLEVPFEIICLDDHSREEYLQLNRPLFALDHVRYVLLEQNIGRSRIRNRLADLAQYDYLLFMDGDSQVVRPDYLQAYLKKLDPQCVIYGGRVYSNQPPGDKSYLLHWHYGRCREAVPPEKRRQHPFRTFMTNNFIVPRSIAQRIRFDESIQRYGYEDTLYALELKKLGYKVIHLDNPLAHLGLEKRPVFLRKVGEALDNLQEILPEHPEINTRLLELVRKLERMGWLGLVRHSSLLWMPLVKTFLFRLPQPSLWLLDLYKLGYFLREK